AERDEAVQRLIGVGQLHSAQRVHLLDDGLDRQAYALELLGGQAVTVAVPDDGESEVCFGRRARFAHGAASYTVAVAEATWASRPAPSVVRSMRRIRTK